jgi:NAD-dependent SIR2 family protein deacetylase
MTAAIAALAADIRDATRVVWLTGAGLSVASGIPPYRRSSEAVWSRFILEWGTTKRFKADPLAWYRDFWLEAHDIDPTRALPNPGHHALTRIVTARPSDLLVTQNVDGLHGRSGLPAARLVEIHGRHGLYRCTDGGCVRFTDPIEGIDVDAIRAGVVPRCPVCDAVVRPLVLLFDERYDSHPFFRAHDAFSAFGQADVIVFVGTSFSVGVTEMALESGQRRRARLININVEPFSHAESWRWLTLKMRDVLGPAEETLPLLADALGV